MEYIYVAAWVCCALICLLGELQSPGFFFMLSGVGGALCGALVAWLGYSFFMQCIVCLLGVLVTWCILSYYVRHAKRLKTVRTNVDALIGRTGCVVRRCSVYDRGLVRIGGEIWSAYTNEQQYIEEGALVEVCAVRGCHLIVKIIDQ